MVKAVKTLWATSRESEAVWRATFSAVVQVTAVVEEMVQSLTTAILAGDWGGEMKWWRAERILRLLRPMCRR